VPKSVLNLIGYTPTELQAWNVELQANKQQVNERIAEIQEQGHCLARLQRSLAQKNRAIREIEMQIETLRMQDMMYQRSTYPYSSSYRYYYNPFEEQLIADLQRLRNERTTVSAEISSAKTAQNRAASQRKQLESRGVWLGEHILAAESFLYTLEQEPGRLVTALQKELLTAIDDYEEQHFIGLSTQVRLSLWQIRLGLEHLVITRSDANEQRLNYLRLCAFLAELHARVQQENKDENFLNCLTTVLQSTHVAVQDDLEGALTTGKTAQEWFKLIQEQRPQIFITGEQEFVQAERIRYGRDRYLPGMWSSQQTKLQRKIIQVLNTLHAEVSSKEQKNEVVDYHFYQRIKTDLLDVYKNPQDARAINRLGVVAEYATGAPLLSKKLLAGLLLVLGWVLIAASVAIVFSPVGACSIFSTWGLALGLGVLETESVSAVGLYVAGFAFTLWGGQKMGEAMRQGFSQELHEVQDVAQAGLSL
jgi:hypothetical protein